MLTARELVASLSVLRAVRTPVCTSVVLTWGPDEVSAYVRLSRCGYVETIPTMSAWDRIRASETGLHYLTQVEGA